MTPPLSIITRLYYIFSLYHAAASLPFLSIISLIWLGRVRDSYTWGELCMMIDGSQWESGLIAWWYCWGRWIVMEHPDLSHCTWLLVWSERLILWDDGEWHVMIEWGDCQRTLMIITEHQWKLSHDFREVDMTMLDGCQSLVLTMWDLESMMFEVVVKGWVAIISWAHLLYHPRI